MLIYGKATPSRIYTLSFECVHGNFSAEIMFRQIAAEITDFCWLPGHTPPPQSRKDFSGVCPDVGVTQIAGTRVSFMSYTFCGPASGSNNACSTACAYALVLNGAWVLLDEPGRQTSPSAIPWISSMLERSTFHVGAKAGLVAADGGLVNVQDWTLPNNWLL